jgi:hypothetical protein
VEERCPADIGDMTLERYVLSMVTPNVRTALETAMLFPPSAIVLISPARIYLALVPTTMASDLSGLRESVEREPSMNSIEAVAHHQQRTRPVQSYVKLSVVSILCVLDDVSDGRYVERKKQGS